MSAPDLWQIVYGQGPYQVTLGEGTPYFIESTDGFRGLPPMQNADIPIGRQDGAFPQLQLMQARSLSAKLMFYDTNLDDLEDLMWNWSQQASPILEPNVVAFQKQGGPSQSWPVAGAQNYNGLGYLQWNFSDRWANPVLGDTLGATTNPWGTPVYSRWCFARAASGDQPLDYHAAIGQYPIDMQWNSYDPLAYEDYGWVAPGAGAGVAGNDYYGYILGSGTATSASSTPGPMFVTDGQSRDTFTSSGPTKYANQDYTDSNPETKFPALPNGNDFWDYSASFTLATPRAGFKTLVLNAGADQQMTGPICICIDNDIYGQQMLQYNGDVNTDSGPITFDFDRHTVQDDNGNNLYYNINGGSVWGELTPGTCRLDVMCQEWGGVTAGSDDSSWSSGIQPVFCFFGGWPWA